MEGTAVFKRKRNEWDLVDDNSDEPRVTSRELSEGLGVDPEGDRWDRYAHLVNDRDRDGGSRKLGW